MAIDHSAGHWLVETVKAMVGSSEPARDTTGTVTRTDPDGTVWVRLAGSTDATPCVRTSASVKPGDVVNVHVEKNRATIVGNYTSPATDDSMANDALRVGSSAKQVADQSRRMAENAIADAERAKKAADAADDAASEASVSARKALSYLLDVEDDWEAIEEYREEAGATVAEIAEDAEQAATDAAAAASSASSAQQSAISANVAATGALNSLSDVESVVGRLAWIQQHSTATTDTTPQDGKSYYIRNATTGAMTYVADVNAYTATHDTEPQSGKTYYTLIDGMYMAWSGAAFETGVTYYERTGIKNPSTEGWYELDQSVQNYIAQHVSLTGDGLWLTADSNSDRILVSTGSANYTPGVHIISGGIEVGSYGENAIIGREDGAHIKVGTNVIYTPTSDTTVVSGKQYYEVNSSGGYDPVSNPTDGNVIAYYERIEEPRIGLWQASTEVAYVTNNELYIPRVVVLEAMRVGNWQWETRPNGNLRLAWIGA